MRGKLGCAAESKAHSRGTGEDNPGIRVHALDSGVNGDPDFRRAANIQRVLDLCLEGAGRPIKIA